MQSVTVADYSWQFFERVLQGKYATDPEENIEKASDNFFSAPAAPMLPCCMPASWSAPAQVLPSTCKQPCTCVPDANICSWTAACLAVRHWLAKWRRRLCGPM